MNNEIKEILDDLKKEDNYWNKQEHNYAFPDYYSLNREDLHLLLDYITNLQQAFERSYTEEQVDFAVNEVKEQLKIEKQYSNQLCNKIDELRIKNYELQQKCEYLERSNNRREDTILGLRQEIYEQEDYKSRCEKANEYLDKVETLARLDGKIIFSINIFRGILQNGGDIVNDKR